MKDMHSNIKIISAIAPQAVGTTGSANGVSSGVIDRQGFESVEFVFQSGTTGTTGDTITPVLTESNATGSGFTAVASGDIIGSVAARALPAAFANSVGYRGSKRYLKLRLYGVGTATALVAAQAVLGNPHNAPVATA